MTPEFKNEPLTDFTRPENARAFAAALEEVRSSFGRTYPLWIGGREVEAGKTFDSTDPARPDVVLGRFQMGTAAEVDQAVEAARRAFETWQHETPEKRAAVLFTAADSMRRRKHWFSAWLVFEVGKSWAEADADTAEAIDFMEFYGREMLRYAAKQPLTPVPGEDNELVYLPLGVGAVIPPWNFPNAILTGMTTAALVAGNTVVLKPSSDAPVIAWQVVQLLAESGLPAGALNFVSGPGGSVGNRMVEHPKMRFIAFTGSKDVGLDINQKAASPRPGQIWIKRVVAEMGGKDSIIVAADADLDQAADGVVASAFGYQGQKCSACSRAIVEKSIYDDFLRRLRERAAKIKVGPPEQQDNWMGPVINAGAQAKILEYVETGRREGRVILGGEALPGPGHFVTPTIVADVAPGATLSQEEIFGPVLAVIQARDWDDAIAIANNTEYGLTGAVYTRDEGRIQDAKRRFHVGNLYFNRKCTGALVGAHPFGGFNMSGTDSKAGGRDYLLLFMQAKAMSRRR
ncbi:MAG TPA: L-glutamate gamma-semialdehyde dehydrogenase [Candidatus Krumholzibacteria bacterium]|nr:L-glutamate gamma-semialdehyde dehydrogenase [Candidatus Krumholzibacteria bacterium]